MNRKSIGVIVVVLIVVAVVAGGFYLVRRMTGVQVGDGRDSQEQAGTINVVAAEDFYGNIASQLGGSRVNVISILSDPNVDPHEYESDVEDGVRITNANIVIENGLEYDTWMDKLLSASPNPARVLITAGNIAPDPLPDNPHVWYGVDNVSAVARAITNALEKVDPSDTATFEDNLIAFDNSLAPIQAKMAEIKSKYAGTPVGLTETIYLYMTEPMGLNVLTPFGFEKAIAEGNDPSAADVNTTNQQVEGKQIKVLIYNSQTVTPITTNLEAAAQARNIPVVPVTETMPPSSTYQAWMLSELNVLEQALAQATGH